MNLCVLLVEDNPADADLVCEMLGETFENPHDIHRVERLSEGVALLHLLRVDIVLLDMNLPDSRGLDTVAALQKDFPDLPVVVLTGIDNEMFGDEAVQMGAQDYLVKGRIRGDALLRSIRYAIDRNNLKRQLQQAIKDAESGEARLKHLVSSIWDGILVIDQEGKGVVCFANDLAASLFGVNPGDLLGRPFHFSAEIGRSEEVEIMREGQPIYAEMNAVPFQWEGAPAALVMLRDVTKQKQMRDRLVYLSYHDDLTGLANRSLLMLHLKQAIARASRTKRWVALLFGDLDNFKQINDTLGHPAGDLLLKEAAKRMWACLREGDSVARFGGDEFVVLLSDLTRLEDISNVAQKILERLSRPYAFEGHAWMTTVSMGIAVYPDDTLDSETLLKYADMALYRAKEGGKNNYHYYSPAIQAKVIERLELEGSLRTALHQERLFLNYQPIVSLRTGQIVGMETLLRLRDTEGRTFVPAQFVPVAEETGMIVPIGEWVLRVSCAQNKAWQEMGLPPVAITVNLSPRQLKMDRFLPLVAEILKETGLAASSLELELTESMMQDAERALHTLQTLHHMGVRTSIDDFGTGYSSLSHLKRFPFHTIKIDASFVRYITTSKEDRTLLETIVIMGHNLKLRAIAEGVENEEQMRILRSMGCDAGQGFFFDPPLSVEEATTRLRETKA